MPRFNIGDRVKRIDQWGGHTAEMSVDSFGIVESFGHGELISVRVENTDRLVSLLPHRFQRTVPVAPEALHRSVFYTLIYKCRMTGVRTMGFQTQREFEEKKEQVLQNGGVVFGEKKITLNVDTRI